MDAQSPTPDLPDQTDVLIVGAGPIGLELAVALKLAGTDYLQVDAGQIGQTITWYPRQVKFFSSPERIGLAGMPLQTADQSKATREEYLAYLRGLVMHHGLQISTYTRVKAVRPRPDGAGFDVHMTRGGMNHVCFARRVVLAVGDMHHPRLLHVPGEEMAHVSHYFDEPHRYFQKKLLIVGGRNSAAEAAIRCFRAGAKVTLSYRRAAFDEKSIKYWLMPELQWLIRHGHITFHPATLVRRIEAQYVDLQPCATDGQLVEDASAHPSVNLSGDIRIEADFVLLLTGYAMDTSLLTQAGAKLQGENNAPVLDDEMQTTVPGLYVAGTAAAGTQE